ncbi:neo-calmodulin-like isoform X2 [Crassostrea virginica]|uniref:Sulfhydryl light chain n=1 Tax=Crassostrea virginica TaxID=6565 RepID=A0A8B8AEF2_CRAVI|nr:calmodulin-like [Crassostrea virginica]
MIIKCQIKRHHSQTRRRKNWAWFDFLDVNRDGKVSVKSIVKGNEGIGFTPTDKEAINIIRVLDTNGSGYVDFEKYEAFIKEYLRKKECEHRIYKKAFGVFDKNGDGSVSYEELKEVFLARGKSEKDVQDFFNEADTDKDGKVDYEEFVIWFSKA